MLDSLSSIWQFYAFLGILGGLGASMVGVIPAQSLVSRWFDKNLGTGIDEFSKQIEDFFLYYGEEE